MGNTSEKTMTDRPTVPRLIFSGSFLADVSTVNNDPEHYDSAKFRSNYLLPYGEDPWTNPNGWWNPNGTGIFSLNSCAITKAVYSDCTEATSSEEDSIIGLILNNSREDVQGKLVNIDPEQQNVFEIWGLKVNLGCSGTPAFESKLAPGTPCADFWKKVPSVTPTNVDPHTLGAYSGVWQGVLYLSSFDAKESKFMQQCEPFLQDARAIQRAPAGLMVIRMNVDNFVTNPEQPNYRYGRMVGSIRPWVSGDPLFYDATRQLRHYPPILGLPDDKENAPDDVFNGYSHVEKNGSDYYLSLDLGNALALATKGGKPKDLGKLNACLLVDIDSPTPIGTKIQYQADNWFTETAGIVQLKLTDQQQANQVSTTRLGLCATKDGVVTVLLAEGENGYNARADMFVYRLNPGEEVSVKFYVTRYGKRVAGKQVNVYFDSSVMAPQVDQGPISGPRIYGSPTTALTLNGVTLDENPEDIHPKQKLDIVPITTCDDGTAWLTIAAKISGPGNPRGYLDGQMYGVTYVVDGTTKSEDPTPIGQMNTSEIVNLLVFDKYDIPNNPSWLVDIQPIFNQYALLYPAMGRIVDLSNYASCMTRLTPLKNAFGARTDDPHYMPVTRDLSENKKATILKWIGDPDAPKRPLYMNIDSKADLMVALQTAIELEHSTIPPYLCALYSIKPGCNQYVADTIRSIVIEEMLHFSISCNILVSIGGSPNINSPGFVPRYPGPLPGGLRRGLIARLRKCSIKQLQAFMSIEEPRTLIETDDGKVDPDDIKYREQREEYTIGFLYDLIKKSLTKLAIKGEISFGHEDKQVEGWSNPGTLNKVLSLEDAIAGINEIEEQGEGGRPLEKHPALDPTDPNYDPETGLPELAHYYKFAEIANGRRIVLDQGEDGQVRGFSYSGDEIHFDPNGVYNMMDDPDQTLLPAGSKQRLVADSFARKYLSVLNGLHKTFNGDPGYLPKAIAAMFQLTISAQPLMELDSGMGDGTTVGLSFQLPGAECRVPEAGDESNSFEDGIIVKGRHGRRERVNGRQL